MNLIKFEEFEILIGYITEAKMVSGGLMWLKMELPRELEIDYERAKLYFADDGAINWTRTSRHLTGTIKDKSLSDFIEAELSKRSSRTIIINEIEE